MPQRQSIAAHSGSEERTSGCSAWCRASPHGGKPKGQRGGQRACGGGLRLRTMERTQRAIAPATAATPPALRSPSPASMFTMGAKAGCRPVSGLAGLVRPPSRPSRTVASRANHTGLPLRGQPRLSRIELAILLTKARHRIPVSPTANGTRGGHLLNR
jgi:hypothetical protein